MDQSVQIFFQFPLNSLENERKLNAVFALEDVLAEIVEKTGVGRFDGNEFCDDNVTFFIYGPDADKIVEEISPVIERIPCLPGSCITKQYDSGGDREEQIFLK